MRGRTSACSDRGGRRLGRGSGAGPDARACDTPHVVDVLYLHQHFATRAGAGGTRSWEFSRRLLARGNTVTMVAQVRRGGGIEQRGRHEVDGMDLILLGGYYTNHLPDWRRAWQFVRVMLHASRRALRPCRSRSASSRCSRWSASASSELSRTLT